MTTAKPGSQEDLPRLEQEARSLRAGSIAVVDAHAELRSDADGGDFVFVRLDLSSPASGQETWPVEDFRELRFQASERLVPHADLPVRISYVGGETDELP